MCEYPQSIPEKYNSEFSKADNLKTYSNASQWDNIKRREKATWNSNGSSKL